MDNPSVKRRPGRNTLAVCAQCKKYIPLLEIPKTFVVLCLDCWNVNRRGGVVKNLVK